MIVDRIEAYLNSENLTLDEGLLKAFGEIVSQRFRYQFMEERKTKEGVIRFSSAGRCPRQQAYAFHGFPVNGKEIDARAKVVFFMGDVTEAMVTSLAIMAGCKLEHIGNNQITVSQPVTDLVEAVGHPDGVLVVEDDNTQPHPNKWLFECKSMASYAFARFEKGEIDDAYRAQVNTYMGAMYVENCIMVALNKDAGVLCEQHIPFDPALFDKTLNDWRNVAQSTKTMLPDRMFAPSGKDNQLPWQCNYCSWWGECWPNAEKVVVKGKYQLQVNA